MAQWLEWIGNPQTSLTESQLNDWGKRDHHVGEVLYQIAWRRWRRLMLYDQISPYFPNCDFSDYGEQQITEENNTEPISGNLYPFHGWDAGNLAGNVNSPHMYLKISDSIRAGSLGTEMCCPMSPRT